MLMNTDFASLILLEDHSVIMKKNGIRMNDLFTFCTPQWATWQLPKNVHFTAAGSKALAGEVAKAIEQELDAERSRK